MEPWQQPQRYIFAQLPFARQSTERFSSFSKATQLDSGSGRAGIWTNSLSPWPDFLSLSSPVLAKNLAESI